MDDRIARLESALEQLQLTVASLQQRLEAVEARSSDAVGAALAENAVAEVAAAPAKHSRSKDPYDPIAILSLVGRLLLVLAGGFFLRAMTEAGYVADPVGISLAFAYAAVWLAMSMRTAKAQLPSAVFHALAAAMVAFPLVVEATLRFKVLTGPGSALALSLVTASMLIVAWRAGLRAAAWITVLGALPAGAVLLVKTGAVVPFAVFLVALGVATLWMSYATGWWGTRWPAALAANLAVAAVTARAFAPEHHDAPTSALLMQLVLLLGYFGSTAYRTLMRGQAVSRFEIAQTAIALAVSLGGALFMARVVGTVPSVFGVTAFLVGGVFYAVAVGVVARREASALNFYFYSTVALTLTLAGLSIAIDGPWAGAAFALCGTLAALLWARAGALYALLHAAVYLVAAVIASGAFGYAAEALVMGMEGAWTRPDAAMLAVLAGAVAMAVMAAMQPASVGGEVATGARFVVILVCVWAAAGLLIGHLAPVVGATSGSAVDPGALATVRTGVLSLTTLLVAWMSRRERLREWGWLVYPLLIGIGLKLMTQDFKHSRPATLFIALALYGAALIVAPRLKRRAEKVAAPTDA